MERRKWCSSPRNEGLRYLLVLGRFADTAKFSDTDTCRKMVRFCEFFHDRSRTRRMKNQVKAVRDKLTAAAYGRTKCWHNSAKGKCCPSWSVYDKRYCIKHMGIPLYVREKLSKHVPGGSMDVIIGFMFG